MSNRIQASHTDIKSKSLTPTDMYKKKEEPKSIPHAGISQPLNPCRILAGWNHYSGKGWMCVDEKFDKFASDELES